jgi:hypothetical protein
MLDLVLVDGRARGIVARDLVTGALGRHAGDAVLLAIGEGGGGRAARWEPGPDQVVGSLSGSTGALAAAARDGVGLLALTTGDDRCRVRVTLVRDGDQGWALCREPFGDFSPDGELVLATDAVGEGVVVRDSRSGEEAFRHGAGTPLRSYGWESAGSLLYAAAEGDDTVVTRCVVATATCSPVLTLPGVDRIPQPVPPRG